MPLVKLITMTLVLGFKSGALGSERPAPRRSDSTLGLELLGPLLIGVPHHNIFSAMDFACTNCSR